MVHSLSFFGDARIGGQIVRVAFSLAQVAQVLICRKEFAGDMHCIDKLLGEVVICPTGHHQFLAIEPTPIEISDLVYDSLVAIGYLDVHFLAPSPYHSSQSDVPDVQIIKNQSLNTVLLGFSKNPSLPASHMREGLPLHGQAAKVSETLLMLLEPKHSKRADPLWLLRQSARRSKGGATVNRQAQCKTGLTEPSLPCP